MEKRKLVILTGPTAVGKTALSIALAKAINAEIISADSMQVYCDLDIGSAKITPEEMGGIRHHLVDCLDPFEAFNVYRFKKMAKDAMETIYAQDKIPLIVGGTGFYIQALLYDIDFSEEEVIGSYRTELERIAAEGGVAELHQRLAKADPVSAETIHVNNVKRVVRALEYHHDTGERISEHNARMRKKASPYDFHYFVLVQEREELYRRIDERVDRMMEKGLADEVKRLREMGLSAGDLSMQGLGYKELLRYYDGAYDMEEAVRIIKRDTRHFAKRQMTWFRREKGVIMVNKRDFDEDDEKILAFMVNHIKNREEGNGNGVKGFE